MEKVDSTYMKLTDFPEGSSVWSGIDGLAGWVYGAAEFGGGVDAVGADERATEAGGFAFLDEPAAVDADAGGREGGWW